MQTIIRKSSSRIKCTSLCKELFLKQQAPTNAYEHARVPLPGSESGAAGALLDFGVFSCEQVRLLSDAGSSGLVYSAVSRDYYGNESTASATLIIKECYPLSASRSLVRHRNTLELREDSPTADAAAFDLHLGLFRRAFDAQTRLYQSPVREQIAPPARAIEQNGTLYLVSDASHAELFAQAAQQMTAEAQLNVLVRLVEVLKALHTSDLIFLDLKPENILAVRNPDASGARPFTGDIKLFDFDSVVPVKALEDPAIALCLTPEWSPSPLAANQHSKAVSTRIDLYPVGAMLFWLLTGRTPSAAEVAHAYGAWHISASHVKQPQFRSAFPQIGPLVNNIFNHTLVTDPALLYQTEDQLIADLQLLAESVTPVSTPHSAEHARIEQTAVAAAEELREDIASLASEVSRLADGSASHGAPESANAQNGATTPRRTLSRRAFAIGAGVIGAASILATGGYFASKAIEAEKPITSYFRDITEQYGLPVGLGEPLSAAEAATAVDYWRIDDYPSKGITEASFVSFGPNFDLIDENSHRYRHLIFPKAAKARYSYDADKEKGTRLVRSCTYLDSNGAEVAQAIYSGANSFSFTARTKQPPLLGSTFFFGAEKQSPLALNPIPVFPRLTFNVNYDDQGRVAKRMLSPDTINAGRCSTLGFYGEAFTYADDGTVAAIDLLDANGNPSNCTNNFSRIEIEREENAVIYRYFSEDETMALRGFNWAPVERHQFNQDGTLQSIQMLKPADADNGDILVPATNKQRVHRFEFDSAKEGAGFTEYYKDANGELCADGTWQSLSRSFSFDAAASTLKVLARSASVISGETLLLDDAGVETSASVIARVAGDSVGTDTPISFGSNWTVPGIIYNLDEKTGQARQLTYLDFLAHPTNGGNGFASACFDYNSDGRIARCRYLDSTGEPTLCANHYAQVETDYDENGFPAFHSFLNADGEPCYSRSDGCFALSLEYQEEETADGVFCRLTERRYEADGSTRMCGSHGYSGRERIFDISGNLLRVTYLDANDGPTANFDTGSAIITCAPDPTNRFIAKYAHHDAAGNPVNCLGTHYHSFEVTVNVDNRSGQVLNKNADGELCYHGNTGVAGLYLEVSEDGRRKEARYLDTDGASPCIDREEGRYGYIQELVASSEDDGYEIIETCLGPNGEPFLSPSLAYCRMRTTKSPRDDAGHFTVTSRFFAIGPDGEEIPIHCGVRAAGSEVEEYDERGARVRRTFYEPDARTPMLDTLEGVHQREFIYGETGKLEWELNYGLDGNLTSRTDCGYAVCHTIYDAAGTLIATEHFSPEFDISQIGGEIQLDRLAINTQTGVCALYLTEPDEHGNYTRESYYFPTEGARSIDDCLQFMKVSTYTPNGICTKSEIFEADGTTPLVHPDGYDAQQFTVDEKGLITKTLYLCDGKPVSLESTNHACATTEYDNLGRRIRDSFFSDDGATPVLSATTGGAMVDYTYDDAFPDLIRRAMVYTIDEETEQTGEIPFGFIENSYDAWGNCIRIVSVGGTDSPASPKTYSEHKQTFDHLNTQTEDRFFDVDGNPVVNKSAGYSSGYSVYNEQSNDAPIRFSHSTSYFTLDESGREVPITGEPWKTEIVMDDCWRVVETIETTRLEDGNDSVEHIPGDGQSIGPN